MIKVDLNILADNGLRRGRTTGTCAAAAVKAGVMLLTHNRVEAEVVITLPCGSKYLIVPIAGIKRLADGGVQVDVVKEAGDDPDVTDGATIQAIIRINGKNKCNILAGSGVGTVTAGGIRVPIGQPAINPVPQKMIQQAIDDALDEANNPGFDISIGCLEGEKIAKRTFNPRLGIYGGISILGTTGIVEPMSLSAYIASIEVYIRVALAEAAHTIAFLPGNLGLNFARQKLMLPPKRIVHISNFLGSALDMTEKILYENNTTLENLWILGHPGKIGKVLDGSWDTHSRNSPMAMAAIAKLAYDLKFANDLCLDIEKANTVEAIVNLLNNIKEGQKLWTELAERTVAIMHCKVPAVKNLSVHLLDMSGRTLAISCDGCSQFTQ